VVLADRAPAPSAEPIGAPLVLVAIDGERRDVLAAQLGTAGYRTLTAASAEDALGLSSSRHLDVVLLDPGLPGASSFEVCRQLRAQTDAGVIFVTDRGSLADRVHGFDCGADDYVVQPVAVVELERRIGAVLRRLAPTPSRDRDQIAGPALVRMHLRAHQASVGERLLDLTPKEFAVLRLLLERRGEVLSSDEISSAIWGYETFGSRNFVEAHVSRLRSKLKAAGARDVVSTVRGVGYVIR
jgi:DNA-binding response OmpR family regulator